MKRVLAYLALVFGITWGVWFALFGVIAANPAASALYVAVVAASMWVPAASVRLVKLLCGEKRVLAASFKPLFTKPQGNWQNYLLAWGLPVAATLVGAVLYFLCFPEQFTLSNEYLKNVVEQSVSSTIAATGGTTDSVEMPAESLWPLLMVFQILFAITLAPAINSLFALGEEIGWRGFLYPQLAQLMPQRLALLLTGIIWGLWHAPIIVLMGHNYGFGYWGAPITGVAMMCLFCVSFGTILSWLTQRSGSIWPAALGHGCINAVGGIGMLFSTVDPAPNLLLGPAPVGFIGTLPFLATVIVVMIRTAKESPPQTNSVGV
ncbi:MAG: CPBP family intramembrane metalloprotease [Coriobacteriales bacterium]|jgi:membrane protease YdiL (CAAX protease family)|nr:CPBP family intramembrane metalloprotease [Coriobacteriales bacterium]